MWVERGAQARHDDGTGCVVQGLGSPPLSEKGGPMKSKAIVPLK